MPELKVQAAHTCHALRGRTLINGKLRTVDDLLGPACLPASRAQAASVRLELEGHGPAVNHADVNPITARGRLLARSTGQPLLPEGRFELRVHRRGATQLRVTDFTRTSTAAQLAFVALAVAPQLGPISGGLEVVRRAEGKRLASANLDVLHVRARAACGHVRNPNWLLVARIPDHQAIACRLFGSSRRGYNGSPKQHRQSSARDHGSAHP
mmetsp:Transcript_15964/g.37800  ORF Transcript_15964/g.37800 Transcript_15964/m.37800 type:complete len:211 (-) Transcript_15964:26-658(-)